MKGMGCFTFLAAFVAVANGADTPERLPVAHLPNAIRLHEQVISGGLPEGDLAFAELQSLGVRTIISVDGAKPQVEQAARFGLRYVHLPHGYDGVPAERAVQLAKAITELPGPFYIHCHHGKHRSPTAAFVACVTAGLITPDRAAEILHFAGTSDKYRGLFTSASECLPMDKMLLNELKADLPETAILSPLTNEMVMLDQTNERLKEIAAANWRSLAGHPDLEPAHQALLLREHFTELLRLPSVQNYPPGFAELLQQSEQASRRLELGLHQLDHQPTNGEISKSVTECFTKVNEDCIKCHQSYRD